jgi:hypothetical protein
MQHGSMTPPSTPVTGFDRIRRKAQAFYDIVARCEASTAYDMDLYEDAYNRLSRLRDRYAHEKDNRTLTQLQFTALRKVFEEDSLIKGMLKARQIGEHVQKRSGSELMVQVYTDKPIYMPVEVSADSFFGHRVFTFKDRDGRVQFECGR